MKYVFIEKKEIGNPRKTTCYNPRKLRRLMSIAIFGVKEVELDNNKKRIFNKYWKDFFEHKKLNLRSDYTLEWGTGKEI